MSLSDPPYSFLGVPERFEQADLLSTNATNTQSAWTAGTYSKGAQVLYSLTPARGYMKGIPLLRVMECLADGTTTPPTDATKWLNTGAANTVGMFASRLAEKTRRTGGLSVTWAPRGTVDYVALFGLEGDAVTVRVKTAAGAVKSERTQTLITRRAHGWRDWFLAPFVQQETFLVRDMLALPGERIEVQVSGAGDCAVGRVSYGQLRWLASTPEYGATWSFDDYTTSDADEFGNVEDRLTKGDYAPRLAFTAQADINRSNEVIQMLLDMRAQPTVFIGTEQDNLSTATVLFGLVKDVSVPIPGPTHISISAEVKGFI